MAEYRHILSPTICQSLVRLWLKEDIPSFDYAGIVVGDAVGEAVLICKSPGTLCGRPFVEALFQELDCSITWYHQDGSQIQPATEIARVKGPVNKLLQGERTALNVLTRASGIASHARQLREAANQMGWSGEIAGTRKTTPGFRMVEKYSLLVGGISTHRYDLSSMIMLKDNHIWSAGSVGHAVEKARTAGGFSLKIEVECRSVQEAEDAINAGADIIMLDNFEPEALAIASRKLKSLYPFVLIEASGGIRIDTISKYCLPTVDVISLSSTTQGYSTVNFSFKIVKEGRNPLNPSVKSNEI